MFPTDAPPLEPLEHLIDPQLFAVVREELARVPARRRAAAEQACRDHATSGFIGTHGQQLVKWRALLKPFQRRAADDVELKAATKALGDGLETVLMKIAGGFEIKDESKGLVQAIVSTMNVVDRDGDVMMPGAITDGAVVKLSAYDHDVITEGLPPVGLGVISIKGDQAIMTGQYFLNTTRGRDAFETVKALGPHSEWSIGYRKNVQTAPMTDEWAKKGARRLITGADVLESSPVFLGANAMTATVATKGNSQADGDGADAENRREDAAEADEKAIAARSDTTPTEGEHKYGDVTFADPTNKKYRIDTEEHIRAAWNYIHHPNAADKYTPEERHQIMARIIDAWKQKIDKNGPPAAMDEHKSAEEMAELERKRAQERSDEIGADVERTLQRFNRTFSRLRTA